MSKALGPSDLVFCSATLISATLEQKLAAAQAGGFAGISLWAHDYADARRRGCSDESLRRLVAEHGLTVTGIDCLLDWIPGDAVPDLPMFKSTEDELYRAVDALGGSWINVAQAFGSRIDFADTAARLDGICRRAGMRQLDVCLEFIPWSGIPTLRDALALITAVDMPNARVTIDAWHFFRGESRIEDLLAVDPGLIRNLQLNDAPELAAADLAAETADRLLPGQGGLALGELINAVRAIGVTEPWGIEAYSPRLAELDPLLAGQRCGAAMRQVLDVNPRQEPGTGARAQ